MECTIPCWVIWISYLSAAIAIPGAIAAFVTLFKKDKDKKAQIMKLTDLSLGQETTNDELKNIFRILNEQLGILKTNSKSKAEINEFDKQIKLSLHRPIFRFIGSAISPGKMKLRFLCVNADAYGVSIIKPEKSNLSIDYTGERDLPKNSRLEFLMRFRHGDKGKQLNLNLTIDYHDDLYNKYSQIIKIENGVIRTLEPVLKT